MAPISRLTATLARKANPFKQEGSKTDRRSMKEIAGWTDSLYVFTRVRA
jgi:hypothetical protein